MDLADKFRLVLASSLRLVDIMGFIYSHSESRNDASIPVFTRVSDSAGILKLAIYKRRSVCRVATGNF